VRTGDKLDSFLTSVIDGDEWLALHPGIQGAGGCFGPTAGLDYSELMKTSSADKNGTIIPRFSSP
jgi:hypothetical protein